jgi:hypothetical protein
MAGDRTPHVYVTHDFGAHWNDLGRGLPQNVEARSVRVDPRNPSVVYAGTDNALYVSFDGGLQWRNFNLNMPAVSVRDIQVQPDADDLLLATHGRAVYVFDDLSPLQSWHGETSARVFTPRPAYQWNLHDYFATHTDGANPPYGALVTYYLPRAQKSVTAEVVDARGRAVRHFAAKDLTGDAGFNRVAWDTAEDKPEDWRFAPTWNQGVDSGASVVPGRYTFVLRAGGQTLRAPIVVLQDPRTHFSAAQLLSGYESMHELMDDFGRVNAMLNTLSTVLHEAPLRANQLRARGNSALALRLSGAAAKADELLLSITQNPVNDQDNDFLTDVLRERLQTEIGYASSNFGPVPQAQAQQIAELHALTNGRERAFKAFAATELRAVNEQLRAAKLPAVTTLTKQPKIYNPGGGADDRRGDDD